MYPTTGCLARFYGLLKIHNVNIPLRPIVSSRGTITNNLAKLLTGKIGPIVGHSEYYIKNSQHLVEKLNRQTVLEDQSLVSYDVTALFTTTPVVELVNIIRDVTHHC